MSGDVWHVQGGPEVESLVRAAGLVVEHAGVRTALIGGDAWRLASSPCGQRLLAYFRNEQVRSKGGRRLDLDGRAGRPGHSVNGTAAVGGHSLRSPVLIGRADELVELTNAVASTAAGRGRLVAVIGEAGVGKSRLVAATADIARSRGMAVLRGRAAAAGATVPYRPWAEALQAAARDPALAEDPALTPFRSALVRLVPAWRQPGALGAPDGSESPVTLGEGILRMLRVIGAGRGTVAVLEDLHWADPDSIALLEYLADKLAEEAILLLVTCRAEESRQRCTPSWSCAPGATRSSLSCTG